MSDTCEQFEASKTEKNPRGNRVLAMKCNMEKEVAAKEQEEFEKTHSVDKAGLSKQKMHTSDERPDDVNEGGKRRRRRRKSRRKSRKSRRKSRKTKRKRRKSRKTKKRRRRRR